MLSNKKWLSDLRWSFNLPRGGFGPNSNYDVSKKSPLGSAVGQFSKFWGSFLGSRMVQGRGVQGSKTWHDDSRGRGHNFAAGLKRFRKEKTKLFPQGYSWLRSCTPWHITFHYITFHLTLFSLSLLISDIFWLQCFTIRPVCPTFWQKTSRFRFDDFLVSHIIAHCKKIHFTTVKSSQFILVLKVETSKLWIKEERSSSPLQRENFDKNMKMGKMGIKWAYCVKQREQENTVFKFWIPVEGKFFYQLAVWHVFFSPEVACA